MAYCMNCGAQINDGAKFCGNCGAKIEQMPTPKDEKPTQRQIKYEGELHKCPSCGATIGSLLVNCPECGFEIRRQDSSFSSKAFSDKIASVEKISQKCEIIVDFPIPNNKEDLYDFFHLCAGKLDGKDHYDALVHDNEDQLALDNAWLHKFEIIYRKMELFFKNDDNWVNICQVYNQEVQDINDADKKHRKKTILKKLSPLFWSVGSILLIAILILIISGSSKEKKNKINAAQNALKEQMQNVENAIANGDLEKASALYDEIDRSLLNELPSDSKTVYNNALTKLYYKARGQIQAPEVDFSQPYYNVTAKLKESGFVNVTTVAREDYPYKNDSMNNHIFSIVYNGTTDYSTLVGKGVDPNAAIIITYYTTAGRAQVPDISYESIDYPDVVKALTDAGFKNVTAVGLGNLITGWITKKDSTAKIIINGDESYYSYVGQYLDEDVEIFVYYNSF